MALTQPATITDADLSRMVTSSWREAARCWQEYRAADPSIRSMLRQSAEYAEAWWRTLHAEQARRAS